MGEKRCRNLITCCKKLDLKNVFISLWRCKKGIYAVIGKGFKNLH